MSDKLIDVIIAIENEVIAINKTSLSWYQKVYKVVEVIVPRVEAIGLGWKGSDKKEFALQIVDEILARYVRVKLPKFLVHFIAGRIIDAVVEYLNKTGVFKKSS